MKADILIFAIFCCLFSGCVSKEPYLETWQDIDKSVVTIKSFDGLYKCIPETSPDWYKNEWPTFFIRPLDKKVQDDYYDSDNNRVKCSVFLIKSGVDNLSITFFGENFQKKAHLFLRLGKDFTLKEDSISFDSNIATTNYVPGIQTSSNLFFKDKKGNLIIRIDSGVIVSLLPIPVFYINWAKFDKIKQKG